MSRFSHMVNDEMVVIYGLDNYFGYFFDIDTPQGMEEHNTAVNGESRGVIIELIEKYVPQSEQRDRHIMEIALDLPLT